MGPQIRAQVRERGANICEYCELRQEDSPLAALHIEHIIPKVHGGSDELDNLALASVDCNLHKGTNLAGIDPETNALTEIFHPRRHNWNDHGVHWPDLNKDIAVEGVLDGKHSLECPYSFERGLHCRRDKP